MSTILTNLPTTRSVKRASSGRRPIAEFLGCMVETFNALEPTPWRASVVPAGVLSVNDPLRPDYGGDELDAYRQSGDSIIINSMGDQIHNVWAGMVCYTVEIPADADETFIREVAFRLDACKNAVGGVKAAAFLSNSAFPPADWEACRRGGVDGAVDSTGNFATPEYDFTVPPNDDAYKAQIAKGVVFPSRVGVLAETAPLRSLSIGRSEVFRLDLSSETRAWKYLHLCVSMFVGSAWRTEYWVEGSAMLRPDTIAVTFDADGVGAVAPSFEKEYGWRVALAQNGDSKYRRFRYANRNITDVWFAMDYTAKNAVVEGAGNLYAEPVDLVKDVAFPAMAPCVYVEKDGTALLTLAARKSEVFFNCPHDIPAGAYVWIKTFEAFAGLKTPVCIVAYAGSAEVGRGEFLGLGAGEWIGIRLKAFGPTQAFKLSAHIPEVARADVFTGGADANLAVGFVQKIGFDFRDAHIAMRLTPSESESGWEVPAPVAIDDGDYMPPPPAFVFNGFYNVTTGASFADNGTLAMVAESGTVMRIRAVVSGGVPPYGGMWSVLAGNLALAPVPGVWNECDVTVNGTSGGIGFAGNDAHSVPQQVSGTLNLSREAPPVWVVNNPGSVSPLKIEAVQGSEIAQQFEASGESVAMAQGTGDPNNYTLAWWKRPRAGGPWQPVATPADGTVLNGFDGKPRIFKPATTFNASMEFRAQVVAPGGVVAFTNTVELELSAELENQAFPMTLYPEDDHMPYLDSLAVGKLVNGRPSSFIGQVFSMGISQARTFNGVSRRCIGGNGLGELNITQNGNAGNNSVSASAIHTLLNNISNGSYNLGIADGLDNYLSSCCCMKGGSINNETGLFEPAGTDWKYLTISKRSGIQRNDGVQALYPPRDTPFKIASISCLYFTVFVDVDALSTLQYARLPFFDTSTTRPLYRINVWMFNLPSSGEKTRAVVDETGSGKGLHFIWNPDSNSFDISQSVAYGNQLRTLFFTETPNTEISMHHNGFGTNIALRLVGSWTENETTQKLETPIVPLDIPPSGIGRNIGLVFTLSPCAIPSTRQASINAILNDNTQDETFVGVGCNAPLLAPIGTGYRENEIFTGHVEFIRNPSSAPMTQYFGLGLNSAGNAPTQNGAAFTGKKWQVL